MTPRKSLRAEPRGEFEERVVPDEGLDFRNTKIKKRKNREEERTTEERKGR